MAEKAALPGEDLDFLNLVLMLSTTAAAELGEAKPGKGPAKGNPARARQLINMLDALEKKTQGRRNPQEEAILASVLKDLREKYVKAVGLDRQDPDTPALGRLAAQAYQKTQRPQ